MIDRDLLKILVCPQNHMPLAEADAGLVTRLNAAIREERIKNRAGQLLTKPVDGGLVRSDRMVLYPVLDGIPVLLADEAISLEQFSEARG
jgi:uncharacterized protein